jgi:hypothetical protein
MLSLSNVLVSVYPEYPFLILSDIDWTFSSVKEFTIRVNNFFPVFHQSSELLSVATRFIDTSSQLLFIDPATA